jgi:hypothetical protein
MCLLTNNKLKRAVPLKKDQKTIGCELFRCRFFFPIFLCNGRIHNGIGIGIDSDRPCGGSKMSDMEIAGPIGQCVELLSGSDTVKNRTAIYMPTST